MALVALSIAAAAAGLATIVMARRHRRAGGGLLLRSATRVIEIEELRKDHGCSESRCAAERMLTAELAVHAGSTSPADERSSFSIEAGDRPELASHTAEEEPPRTEEASVTNEFEEGDLESLRCKSGRGGSMRPSWTLSDPVHFDPTAGRPRRVRTDDWD